MSATTASVRRAQRSTAEALNAAIAAFQKYGMLTGKVIRLSADANESSQPSASADRTEDTNHALTTPISTYKARIKLDPQKLTDPQKNELAVTSGMQIVAEIKQGQRSVLEYLLSPVQKVVNDAGRERQIIYV